jgi:hypothetical protein
MRVASALTLAVMLVVVGGVLAAKGARSLVTTLRYSPNRGLDAVILVVMLAMIGWAVSVLWVPVVTRWESLIHTVLGR